MENIIINNNTYKIKEMNAIELLAFRTQINFDTYEDTMKLYDLILRNIEVEVNGKWIQVKQGNNYYPKGLENDAEVIQKLFDYFLEYIKSVFTKSNS